MFGPVFGPHVHLRNPGRAPPPAGSEGSPSPGVPPEAAGVDDGGVVRPVTPGFGGYGGDQVDFKVGAASKGIIQRDFQHHATVFKSAYAKNPFDNVTAEELDEYRRIIDSKSRQDGGKYCMIDFLTLQ